ncbi:MAG TPA: hypothetical protein ENK57_12085 [Polyangiaceae bacterium]|nr:hypothetical protein [Polyangiaceae bacterium]
MDEKKIGLSALVDAAAEFRSKERAIHLQLENSSAQLVQWAYGVSIAQIRRSEGDASAARVKKLVGFVLDMLAPDLEDLATLRGEQPEGVVPPMPKGQRGRVRGGTINHPDPDVQQVAAALADAAHAGCLSNGYYRRADDALERLAARLPTHEEEPLGIGGFVGELPSAKVLDMQAPESPIGAARAVALTAEPGADVGETVIGALEAYDRELWAFLARKGIR